MVVLLASIYLVIAPFYDYPMESLYCLLFILFGIPMYFIFVKWNILQYAKGCNSFIGKLCALSQVFQYDRVRYFNTIGIACLL